MSLKKLLAYFGILFSVLILLEIGLRMLGYEPWQYRIVGEEPTVHEPHYELGWKNKPGVYTFPPYHPSGSQFKMTFLENGQRATQSTTQDLTKPNLILIGGSFTQGWAIDDTETFGWKLQNKYDSMNILNFGVGGYGGYQSLLTLETILQGSKKPKYVVYGLMEQHSYRNVAPSNWLHSLSSYSKRGHVDVPYATYSEQTGLKRHKPTRFLALPLRESLVLVSMIERAYMKLSTMKRAAQGRPVTEEILRYMDEISKKNGANFLVVILDFRKETKGVQIDFLEENGIDYIDCSFDMTDDMRVKGESHPNSIANSLWSQCIKQKLDQKIKVD